MTPNQPVIIQIGCVTVLLLVAITINSVLENDHISELDKKIDSLNQKLQGNGSTTALTYCTYLQTGIYDGIIKMLVTDNKTNSGELVLSNSIVTKHLSLTDGCNFGFKYYQGNFTMQSVYLESGICTSNDWKTINTYVEGYLLTERTTLH